MKWRKNLYIALIAIGLGLAGTVYLFLDKGISSRGTGALIGIASGLTGMSVSQLLTLRMEDTDPSLRKRNEIERKDERNLAIRRRAKALSGDVLLWAVIGMSWLSFGLGAPSWILLLAAAVFVVKSLLELCLMVRYQREM
ncbi:hypothetical protein [uncultured Oscillibacter sp.]|uniref:hypothetical protein n=2 Tax=uncultured Oscillibacter sp. TaxID=876091 RepID=UPI002631A8BB|nr:hypothetical protein [uncultured Oscillibacter sp.]